MSTNLDRSLDEILSDNKPSRRGGRGGPAGGVGKRSARLQQQQKNAPAPAAKTATKTKKSDSDKKDTKIIVSNLPFDITEPMIKEYFSKTIGPVKRCAVTYGPNGQSRGIATIDFATPGHANEAFARYNGTTVDKRPMKVEIVIDPTKPATFADRIGGVKPTTAPRSAAASKPKAVTAANTGNNATRGRNAKRGGRGGRGGAAAKASNPKKTTKTAEELDADMADYFTAPGAAAADGTAPAQDNKMAEDDALPGPATLWGIIG